MAEAGPKDRGRWGLVLGGYPSILRLPSIQINSRGCTVRKEKSSREVLCSGCVKSCEVFLLIGSIQNHITMENAPEPFSKSKKKSIFMLPGMLPSNSKSCIAACFRGQQLKKMSYYYNKSFRKQSSVNFVQHHLQNEQCLLLFTMDMKWYLQPWNSFSLD